MNPDPNCSTLVWSEGKRWLTTKQVNVEMPDVPSPSDLGEQYKQLTYFEDVMLGKHVFCMAVRQCSAVERMLLRRPRSDRGQHGYHMMHLCGRHSRLLG